MSGKKQTGKAEETQPDLFAKSESEKKPYKLTRRYWNNRKLSLPGDICYFVPGTEPKGSTPYVEDSVEEEELAPAEKA